MESKNIEKEVENFEKFVGPLTEKYPFDYPMTYRRSNEPYCHNSNPLTLNLDGTYKASYVFGYEESYSSYLEFTGYGTYHYSVKDRTLTLEPERREGPNTSSFESKVAKGVFEKPLNEFFHKKLIIPNFTWISPTIQFPWIRLSKTSPEGKHTDLDFDHPKYELVDISAEYHGENRFLRLLDLIETLSKDVSNSPSTITEPVKYEDLVLKPDGSFECVTSTSSWDRDGCYNWDSSFRATGKWNYDFENKVMRLTYESFKYDDNGKQIDPSTDSLFSGRVDETTNFYFTSNYLFGISCDFYFSTPRIRFCFLKKVNK